jgi:hypothetical protein
MRIVRDLYLQQVETLSYIISHGIELGLYFIHLHRRRIFFRWLLHDGLHCHASTSSTTTIPSILFVQVCEKLTKINYPLWRTQVLPAIHTAQLKDLLTGDEVEPAKTIAVTNRDKTTASTTNPSYVSWVARDQAVLRYLLSSLTHEMLMHVSRCTTTLKRCLCISHGAQPRRTPRVRSPTSTCPRRAHALSTPG